jgi:hypothetical protein
MDGQRRIWCVGFPFLSDEGLASSGNARTGLLCQYIRIALRGRCGSLNAQRNLNQMENNGQRLRHTIRRHLPPLISSQSTVHPDSQLGFLSGLFLVYTLGYSVSLLPFYILLPRSSHHARIAIWTHGGACKTLQKQKKLFRRFLDRWVEVAALKTRENHSSSSSLGLEATLDVFVGGGSAPAGWTALATCPPHGMCKCGSILLHITPGSSE